MKTIFKVFVLAVFVLFPTITYADDSVEISSIVSKYFDALRVYDTEAMSSLMHPDALEQFRSSFDNAFEGSKSAQAKKELLPLLSLNDYSEYLKLSNKEAYKRLNDGIASHAPELIEMMKSSEFEIVSTTVKNDTAYVIYKLGLNINGRNLSQEAVQKLKKQDAKWLLLLPSTAESSIANIHARFN